MVISMKRMSHFYIFLIISSVFVLSVKGEDMATPRFKNIALHSGLSDNKVNAIYKDVDGFMWFGTDYGLSRFNGSSIKNFTLDNSRSYVSNITQLAPDRLCVEIDNSFYSFNQTSETFHPLQLPEQKGKLLGIKPLPDNSCWLIGETEIMRCRLSENKETGVITFIPTTSFCPLPFSSGAITSYAFSTHNHYLYLTDRSSHLSIIHLPSQVMEQYIKFENSTLEVKTLLDFNHYIWIGTVANGIYRVDKVSGSVEHFSYDNTEENHQMSHTDVFKIIPISHRLLLAVTWNGYTLLRAEDECFSRFNTCIYNNVALAWQDIDVRMLSVYYDEGAEILWIGTYGGGVIYADLKQQKFHKYLQNRSNEIRSITTDKDGFVWMATFHKGIMKSTTPFQPSVELNFMPIQQQANKPAPVLCMYNDTKNNELWFGDMEGKIHIYNATKKTLRMERLFIGTEEVKMAIWTIFIDSKNITWIGTLKGLLQYSPQSKRCVRHEASGRTISEFCVRVITETSDGQLWIGTEEHGLGKMLDDGSISFGYGKEERLNQITVRALHATENDELYIGYANGLAIMDLKKERIVDRFTTKNGLYSNFVSCILEDANRQIWVGTSSCVSRFDHQRKLFFHYLVSGNNQSAYIYGHTLFWGNNKNLTYFCPQEIDAVSTATKADIHSLEIDHQMVNIGDTINGQVILTQNLFYTKQIKLNHRNKDFALSFSSLVYSEQQSKMRYRLYPYQKNWITTDKEDKVAYHNLKAGLYTFEVQILYPSGYASELSQVEIQILPHWLETWWFRLLLAFIVILFLLLLLHRIRIKQQRLRHELQLQHEVFTAQVERDKEKQIREEREKFFTNTAHELRTPLTIIISPLQEIIHTLPRNNELFTKLQTIYKNCQTLHTLIDHLLYVQKIESGMVTLEVTQTDVNQLLHSVGNSFTPLSEIKKIDYRMDIPDSSYLIWIDENKIASAIQNLLSNAFKYTPNHGRILLQVEAIEVDQQKKCKITVSDTGQGISAEYQQHIFDSFITTPNVPTLSSAVGIGLHIVKHTIDLHHGNITLQSLPGQGSTFTLYIPEGKEHFCQDPDVHLQEPISHPHNGQSSAISKQSILVIEDNQEVRTYICSLFQNKYNVIEAPDGAEGVQLAMEKQPTLIITDIMMPVKDGVTCCKEIKASPRTAHIPVLMLTAKGEDGDMLQAINSGADDYMIKPFNPQILISKVHHLIQQRNKLKQIYTQTLMLNQHQQEAEENGLNKENEFLQSVIQVIEANLSNEKFNVKILAEQLNMSQPTLFRKLKQVSKLNAIDMIHGIRMSKVASLLLEQQYTLQEISERVGYNDIRTLRKHFIEQFGVSPSKFLE